MKKPPDIRSMMGALASKMGPPPAPRAKRRKAKRAKSMKAKATQPTQTNPAPVLTLVPGGKAPPLKIPPTALGLARRRVRSRLNADRPMHENPYRLPDYPKEVLPPAGHRLAMDEVPALAWAQSNALSGAFWEGQAFLGYAYLAELAQRPEYRRISERIATEATRKWIKLQITTQGPPQKDGTPPAGADPAPGDDENAAKLRTLEDEMKRLKVQDCFRQLAEQDGLFGCSHLYLDTGSTDDQEELVQPLGDGRNAISLQKVTKGTLKRLQVVEPMWCYPSGYNTNDPLKPSWYKPESWFVMGKQVHGSRLLTFVSREVPDILKPAYAFGGLSLSQMAKPYVDNWLNTRQSVADLIQSFSTMILQTDLQSALQADGTQLFERMDLFNLIRDNRGLMAINKDTEDLKNVTTPLSTLDMLQAQSQEQMASVCGIPIVILLGIQPMGLNASSEGEIRVFYDLIAAYQKAFFAPNLTRVLDFIQLSLFGKIDPDITFRFEPLWSLDEKGRAELRKIEAETDTILIDGGIIDPAEARERVASDPESPYASIDVEDVPEPPEQNDLGGPGTPGPGNSNPPGDGPGGGQPEPKGAADAGVLPFAGATDAGAFNEADHPRAPDGKFGSGGGSAKGGAKASASNIGEQIDGSKLHKVGPQMGSNPGGVFKDDAGRKYYVKKGKTPDHVRNEMTAAALYDLAGAPTLKYRPVKGGTHIATEMAELDKGNAHDLSDAERKEAFKDFAVHAWLGNYDAVGTGGDNLGTIDGVVTALDLGGALEYRAQGLPKGERFGNTVGEIDSLRNPSINPDGAKIFGKMTPEQLKESASYVTSIPDDEIRKTVKKAGSSDALADKLIARKRDIAKRFDLLAKDEAKFEESKHPRDADGKFATTAGGEGSSEEKPAIKEPEKVVSELRKLIKSHSLGKGSQFDDHYGNPEFEKQKDGSLQMGVRYFGKWEKPPDADPNDDDYDWEVPTKETVEAAKNLAAQIGEKFGVQVEVSGGEKNWTYFTIKPKKQAAKPAEPANPLTNLKIENQTSKQAPAAPQSFASKKDHVAHLLQKGTTTAEILEATGWPSVSVPAQAKAAGLKLVKYKEGGVTKYKGTPMTDAEKQAAAAETKQIKAAAAAAVTATTPAPKSDATPAELEQAKKTAKLQLQYVQNAPQTPEAQKLVDQFNSKYENKPLSDPAALHQKVADFKALKAAMIPLMSAEQKKQAEAAAAAKAAQDAKNKAAAEKLKAAEQAAAAKNAEYMKALGISKTEAAGFNALVKMHASGYGVNHSEHDLIEKFKTYEGQAKQHGYPITGFQYALIRDYIDGGYHAINAALRAGSTSQDQHVYAKLVNDALEKMPKYEGQVTRGTTLPANVLAKYKPGHVVTEHAFTSTGVDFKFSGNVSYKIKSIGRRGADFSKGANTGEREVLFKAGTQFLVHKVEKKGNVTHIEMEEVEHYG